MSFSLFGYFTIVYLLFDERLFRISQEQKESIIYGTRITFVKFEFSENIRKKEATIT